MLLQLFFGQDLGTIARIATFHFLVVTKNATVESVRYLLGVLVLWGLSPGVPSFIIDADSPMGTRPQGFRYLKKKRQQKQMVGAAAQRTARYSFPQCPQYVQFTDPFSFVQGPTLGLALQQQTQICGSVDGCRTAAGIRRGTLAAMICVRFARILLVVETSYNWISKR